MTTDSSLLYDIPFDIPLDLDNDFDLDLDLDLDLPFDLSVDDYLLSDKSGISSADSSPDSPPQETQAEENLVSNPNSITSDSDGGNHSSRGNCNDKSQNTNISYGESHSKLLLAEEDLVSNPISLCDSDGVNHSLRSLEERNLKRKNCDGGDIWNYDTDVNYGEDYSRLLLENSDSNPIPNSNIGGNHSQQSLEVNNLEFNFNSDANCGENYFRGLLEEKNLDSNINSANSSYGENHSGQLLEEDNCDSNLNGDSNRVGNGVRRSVEEKLIDCGSGATDCDEEERKKRARLIRNRESAQLSRQRKKQYVDELEEKVKSMSSTINELNLKMTYVLAENASLKQQLSGNAASAPMGFYGPLPAAAAPMGQFPYFVPGYGFGGPQGARVPLVPIPRLKNRQVSTDSQGKKSESKKAGSKTKKVAGVSILGLLLVMFLCGLVVPGFMIRNGGNGSVEDNDNGLVLSGHKEKIFSVSGRTDCLNSSGEVGYCSGKIDSRHSLNGRVSKLNSSETLPALLYVPRDGKHVKINGNLIIHSVLASEKAMAQQKTNQVSSKDEKETSLVISGSVMSTLAVPLSGSRQLKADEIYLNNPKTALGDVQMPQWFREGLAGPILQSGMCTEVFQFDASPDIHSSGIVPATSVANSTSIANASGYHSATSPQPLKIKNRRIMNSKPALLNGTTAMNKSMQFDKPSKSRNVSDTKPASSIVVSILADPKEVGDGDGNERVTTNSISRIFVVVLLDSVKYVTYSCILPYKSSSTHLVN